MIDMQGVLKLRIAAGAHGLCATQMRFAFLDLKNSNSDDTRPEATGPSRNAPSSPRFATYGAPKEIVLEDLSSMPRLDIAAQWKQLRGLLYFDLFHSRVQQPVG
jgi:hypothetical protein